MLDSRLRSLRSQLKLTQENVAKKIGVARTTYAMYEQGSREPDNETLQRLADFFNVSVDYLLGRTNDPTPPLKDADEQKSTLGEIDDPELGLWFKELLDAPEERREELRKIWEIIKQREAGRKPGDKQGE